MVFQSLWGNTAAIAHAIGAGIGDDAVVGGTETIDPAVAAECDLLVIGAPVHAMTLPTAATMASVAKRPVHVGDLEPDVNQPPLREWIDRLPMGGPAAFVAFDTRVAGFVGRGGTTTIERLMGARGYRMLSKSEGFQVVNRRTVNEAASMLRPGEIERARAWGARLAQLV